MFSNFANFFTVIILICWIIFVNFFLNHIDVDEVIVIVHVDHRDYDVVFFDLNCNSIEVDQVDFSFNNFDNFFVDQILIFYDFLIICLEDFISFFEMDFFFDFLNFLLIFFNLDDILILLSS